MILHSEVSTYPEAPLSAIVRKSTFIVPGQVEQQTSLTPRQTSPTQPSTVDIFAQVPCGYSYPNPLQPSFYHSLPRQSPVVNPDSRRPPSEAGPNDNVEDMIDPLILPPPESSPLASRVNQAELNRLESSITGDLADMRAESEADGTVSMEGKTESLRQEYGMPKANWAAQTDWKKVSTNIGPNITASIPRTSRIHTVEHTSQDVETMDHGRRQNRRLKRNHQGPEENKKNWCPDPDCPQRRKSISTIDKHVTSDKDHPVNPQPPSGPGSKVLQRPKLPTYCSECATNLNNWKHSWLHIQTHQREGMSKKTYLTMCRSYSEFLFTFDDVSVKNPDWVFADAPVNG